MDLEIARITLTGITTLVAVVVLRYTLHDTLWWIAANPRRMWVAAVFLSICSYPATADGYKWLLNLIFGG